MALNETHHHQATLTQKRRCVAAVVIIARCFLSDDPAARRLHGAFNIAYQWTRTGLALRLVFLWLVRSADMPLCLLHVRTVCALLRLD